MTGQANIRPTLSITSFTEVWKSSFITGYARVILGVMMRHCLMLILTLSNRFLPKTTGHMITPTFNSFVLRQMANWLRKATTLSSVSIIPTSFSCFSLTAGIRKWLSSHSSQSREVKARLPINTNLSSSVYFTTLVWKVTEYRATHTT